VFAGLYPNTWPLPLSRQGLISAAQNPVHQPVPTGPVVIKKQPACHGPENASAIKTEKVHTNTNASARPHGCQLCREHQVKQNPACPQCYPAFCESQEWDRRLDIAVTAIWVTAAICYWC